MPYYKCTFVDENGRYVKRVLFSDGKTELKNTYMGAEEKLLSVRQAVLHNVTLVRLFSKKIGHSEFLLFNQKLITLLRAGVSFIRALEIIIQDSGEGVLKEVLIQIRADIKNGMQISEAFSSTQIPFHRIYRASLLAGEKSGDLESILEKFNIYLEKITQLRRKTLSSLSYPVILFVFMIAMVMLILLYAIPKFSSFYESFEAQLPTTTRFLISLAEGIQRNILWVILPLLAIYIGLKLVEKLDKDVVIFDALKVRIPFIGRIILENAMAVFSRTLAILIAGGIPVPEATAVAVDTLGNRYLLQKAADVPRRIKEGNLLSAVLAEVDYVPGMMVEVVKVGESSGSLIDVLNKNADFYENAIDMRINTMVSLIEPILIICLGVVIAFMLISVYLPIFQTIQVVR